MRWTKGKYQFFVCTHIDKGHIHNHIYYNSTAHDCSRKFHNFIGSSLRCGGSLTGCASSMSCPSFKIRNSTARAAFFTMPVDRGKTALCTTAGAAGHRGGLGQRPADFPAFLRLMEESGFQVKHGRGGAISFLAPGQDKYTRLRASTLAPVSIPMTSGR